jgi:hypothetical protein
MAHYAIIDDENKVIQVIVGIDETENPNAEQMYSEMFGNRCKRTSYNTLGGRHYSNETGKWSKARQFRGNFATKGMIYDDDLDVFYDEKPFESWLFNDETYTWDPPIPYPADGNEYEWNEPEQKWDLIEADQTA